MGKAWLRNSTKSQSDELATVQCITVVRQHN